MTRLDLYHFACLYFYKNIDVLNITNFGAIIRNGAELNYLISAKGKISRRATGVYQPWVKTDRKSFAA